MAIDVDKAVGAEVPSRPYRWDEDSVILYNLGVGAGDPPTDPIELRYAYEGDLRALPTFGTIPPFEMMMSLASVDGVDIDLGKVLHGSQRLEIHRPIPVRGSVSQTGRITAIHDRGKGALVVLEVVSTLDSSGERLFTNRSTIYIRGEGGFGGDPGPASTLRKPERASDLVVVTETLPQQALLYRMSSGDKNPLHADPGFAAFAGFERPILHGLCTYGIVCKAVVDEVLGGETTQVGWFEARFTGHVFPGETLVTAIWDEGDQVHVETRTSGRDTVVLSDAALGVLRP
jgi:acyl dehydratase